MTQKVNRATIPWEDCMAEDIFAHAIEEVRVKECKSMSECKVLMSAKQGVEGVAGVKDHPDK